MSATARARAALPGVAPIGGASTVHSEPARASAREVEESALKQSSKSPAVDLSGTIVLHPAGSSDEPGAGGGSSAPPRRVSNAFLTQAAPGERVWLIVLNHTLPSVAARLWETAHRRVCADGGANRVFDALPRSAAPPDAILGDLDSIRPEVCQAYASGGVPVTDLSDDQDSTDLDKCIEHVRREMQTDAASGPDTIAVVGAIGGRLDHTLGNLNALYVHADLPLVLIGDGNFVRLLRRGRTQIAMNAEAEGVQCGVIPLGEPAVVTSRGLRWDMDGLELRFAGMISACNQVAATTVDVETSAPCLWITTEAAVK